jgi:hypothetical protein
MQYQFVHELKNNAMMPVSEMIDSKWNMKPNKAKAMMLAKRQLAEFVCDAVNLEGRNR